jgi:hypothetical protein
MTLLRDTAAISKHTIQPVSAWSKEWRIENDALAVLKMSKQE